MPPNSFMPANALGVTHLPCCLIGGTTEATPEKQITDAKPEKQTHLLSRLFGATVLLMLINICHAAETIYKCTSNTGALTFSSKPCPTNAVVKKIEPRDHVIDIPVLPGNIRGRRGQISPQPPVDTSPHRAAMPQVLESCRMELFNLKRAFDARFADTERNLTTARAALAQNTAELTDAQTSKVGLEWGIKLSEQRRAIEAQLKDAEAGLVIFYPDEKAKFEEIGSRCRKK
jgi:hypothetical protein